MKIKVQLKEPDKRKYYSVRAGNNLTELKKWIKWAKRNYQTQKFVIVNKYKQRMKSKKYKEYWKTRYMEGQESKYMVYATY